MLHVERLERIREYIVQNKYANIIELAKLFNTSQATIRRCLKELEQEKLIESVRGGAMLVGDGNIFEQPYQIKQQQNTEEKDRIAREACNYVQSNCSIFMDASSTVLKMAKYLKSVKNVAISTNDVAIARELNQFNDIMVNVTGGLLRHGYFTLTGYFAEKTMEQLRVDYAFMGIDAVSPEGQFMITNAEEIGIKRKAAGAAGKVIVLCDHLKFNKAAFLNLWDIDNIYTVITGLELDDKLYEMYTEMGMNIKRV